jgi:hypothetical protein
MSARRDDRRSSVNTSASENVAEPSAAGRARDRDGGCFERA